MGTDISKLFCAFCGKTALEVKKLVAGSDVCICDSCIDVCHDILYETPKPALLEAEARSDAPPAPAKIKAFLDEYVIGQDRAKEALAVAVYNHYKRIANPTVDGVEIDKSNVLLIGPTGVGKTLLAQTVARLLDVPIAICDATALTEAGYVGEDVEAVVGRLLTAAGNDVKRCEKGIIFLDEIDKKRSRETANGRDVSGEGVQQALLKLLEGNEVSVPLNGRKGPNAEMVTVSTRNILFIASGAFVGLEKVIERAKQVAVSFGFTGGPQPAKNRFAGTILPDHLMQFGMIPELVGRLPVIAMLEELRAEQLARVLTEPRHAITKQVEALFRLDGVQLDFHSEALLAIAEQALAHKTGGRGLRAVVEAVLQPTHYRLPDLRDQGVQRIIVTSDAVRSGAEPEMIYGKGA